MTARTGPPRPGTRRVRFAAAAALLAAAVLSGCGPTAPPTAPVTGLVTIQGKPAPGVRVRFLPVRKEGEPSFAASEGVTDDGGRYELSYYDGEAMAPGAVTGQHLVVLSDQAMEAARDERVAPNRVNSVYKSAGTTPLEATVLPSAGDPAAAQEIDFDLKGV